MVKRERPSGEKKKRKQAKTEEHVELAVKEEAKETQAKISKPSSAKKRKPKRKEATGRQIFLRKTIELAVSLLPGSLRNSEEFVEDSIRGLLMKYVEGLDGILMGYENVKLIEDKQSQGRGWILNELPHIHYKASCDALVFCPSVGCEVGMLRLSLLA
jgi:hypothetical protein